MISKADISLNNILISKHIHENKLKYKKDL